MASFWPHGTDRAVERIAGSLRGLQRPWPHSLLAEPTNKLQPSLCPVTWATPECAAWSNPLEVRGWGDRNGGVEGRSWGQRKYPL